MALTSEDKTWLQQHFATKIDLDRTETRVLTKVDAAVRELEVSLDNSFNKSLSRVETNLTKRINDLEISRPNP